MIWRVALAGRILEIHGRLHQPRLLVLVHSDTSAEIELLGLRDGNHGTGRQKIGHTRSRGPSIDRVVVALLGPGQVMALQQGHLPLAGA